MMTFLVFLACFDLTPLYTTLTSFAPFTNITTIKKIETYYTFQSLLWFYSFFLLNSRNFIRNKFVFTIIFPSLNFH